MQKSKPKNSIKSGTVYKLGNHLLLCGSALNTKLIDKFLSGHKISSLICDIPYGVEVVESKSSFKQKICCQNGKKILNDQYQTDEEYKNFNKKWLENVKPYLANKNSVYIFNSDKMIFPLREAMIETGYKFSQLIIWVKNHSVINRLDYLSQHELVAYGWYGTHKFKRSKDKSVIFYPKPNKSKLHPTMKPVGLLRQLILNSTNINDVVCDLFSGSGSLAIAAEQTQRKCLMVEIDSDYCQTIINRFEKFTGIKAKRLKELKI